MLEVGPKFLCYWIILGTSAQGGRGGGSFPRRSMSLNTDYGNEKEREGILEELFIHEGSHASLDGYHANVIYCYSCLYAIFLWLLST